MGILQSLSPRSGLSMSLVMRRYGAPALICTSTKLFPLLYVHTYYLPPVQIESLLASMSASS